MPKFSTKIKQISGNFKTVDGVDVSISDATERPDLFSLGSDLITNGNFSTDTNWTKTGSVTISNGSSFSIVDGAYARVTQTISFTNNKVYKVALTVSGDNGFKMRVRDNLANDGALNTTSANTIITLTGSTQNIEFFFRANPESTGISLERHSSTGTYNFSVTSVTLEQVDETAYDNNVILIGDNNAVGDDSTTEKTKLSNFLVYIQNKFINATTSLSGLMSSNDKGKLDNITGVTHIPSTAVDLGDISTNATAISNNASAISNNSSSISTNSTNIGTLTTAITTNANAIALNTAKTGITAQQISDITANNAKIGITQQQADDITANNAKIGITSTQANQISTNTTDIATNSTNISNKADTTVVNNALNNITLSSPTSSQIPLQATTIGGTAESTKTININAGTNISFSNSNSGQFTINSTSNATPAGSNGQIQYNNNGAFGATTLSFSPASGSDPAVLSFGGTLKIDNVQAEDDDRPIISTDNNETTISGRVNIATREIKIQSTQQNVGTGRGDVVYYGSVADSGSLTAGRVYYYAPNGNWTLANASAIGTSSGILGVALGASPTTNGLLVNGTVFLDHHASTGNGKTLYLSTTAGQLTSTKPTGTNQVRIVGTVIIHHINRCQILFNPTNFDGQATNPVSSTFTATKSYSLDGINDYAYATNMSGISNWGKNEGTYSAWVNLDNSNAANTTYNTRYLFFWKEDDNHNNFIGLHLLEVTSSTFALVHRYRHGSTTRYSTVFMQNTSNHGFPFHRSANGFGTDEQRNWTAAGADGVDRVGHDAWIHIAVTWNTTDTYTYNGNTYTGRTKVYLNGELRNVGQGNGVPGFNQQATAIGLSARPNADDDFSQLYVGSLSSTLPRINMYIKDLAMWNTELDANKIAHISDKNSGTDAASVDLGTASGNYTEDDVDELIGWWKFEDNGNDSSDSGNNLTFVGETESQFITSVPGE